MKKNLLIGLGNPILTDDGIGLHIVRNLKNFCTSNKIETLEQYVGGLSLIEACLGYSSVFIIDSILTGQEPGTLFEIDSTTYSSCKNLTSSHDTNIFTALELFKKLKMEIPAKIHILGVEAADVETFSEHLSTTLNQKFSAIMDKIKNFIEQNIV